ncbi:MAG: hypothetical protein QM731_21360 [Chitinophagaceae bacterium]
MKFYTICCILLTGLVLQAPIFALAQNLSFTRPANFLPHAATDNAIDITHFKKGYFVAWKEIGKKAMVHVCYLGQHYDTIATPKESSVQGSYTAFAPVFRVLNERLYLFWLDPDGSIKYVLSRTDTSFNVDDIYTLKMKNSLLLSQGISTAAFSDRIILASHTTAKNDMVYAVVEPGTDGLLKEAEFASIPGGSADYPFVTALDNRTARFCWQDNKTHAVSYADCDISTGKWTTQVRVGDGKTDASPALYKLWNTDKLFYIWKGWNNDRRIYYATEPDASVKHVLPQYFATGYEVSICNIDNNNFIMAYAGADGKLYMSNFSAYKPASWMKDLLLPAKGNYTLRDIVLPGSHDAGMSKLNGIGGMQPSTINECNTLTQTNNIATQLNEGIRMFDLRVGTYKKQLYTKHCSSDCMDEAVGGGYGEKLSEVLNGIRKFVQQNRGEIVLLTFSHFCEKETPINALVDSITKGIGEQFVYRNGTKKLHELTLNELAGKVLVTFEEYTGKNELVGSCSIAPAAETFINFRREYAATNSMKVLLEKEQAFFTSLNNGAGKNDLIRLDWQITQSSDEAAMVCNDFQSEKINPAVSGAMLLTNIIRKHESIIDHAVAGNKYLPAKINEWIDNGIISSKNKPNILYVDVAGGWITDYCIDLNNSSLYERR